MTVPSVLFTDYQDEASAGAVAAAKYYETGLTSTALGNTFGAQSDTLYSAYPFAGSGKTIRFQGEYYSAHGTGTGALIYKKDDGDSASGGWTLEYTPATTVRTTLGCDCISAFVEVVVSGTPTLVCIYRQNSAVNAYGVIHFDGTTWTEPVASYTLTGASIGSTAPAALDIIAHENEVFFFTSSGSVALGPYVYDPVGQTITTVTFETVGAAAPGAPQVGKFFVLNTNVYWLGQHNTSPSAGIWRYDGSTAFDVAQSGIGSLITPLADRELGKWAAWVEGGKAYIAFIGLVSADRGWQVYEVPTSGSTIGTPVDVTSTVFPTGGDADDLLPAGVATGAGFGNTNEYAAMHAVHDPEDDSVYLYHGTYQGGVSAGIDTWLLLLFTDGSTAVALAGVGSGGATNEAPPSAFFGGYSFLHEPGILEAWITTDPTSSAGGLLISFKAAGDSGSADKVVSFKVSINGEPSDEDASLFGSATGGSASRNGNTVEDVDADGSTTYTVLWNPGDNGVSSGDYVQLTPKITE